MSQLRKPSLGPIVGHTTPHSCKIWIRAGDPDDTGAELAQNRRTLAVIAIYDKQGKLLKDGNNSAIHYFRLHREQDRSGTFEIGVDDGIGKSKAIALKPDQQYFATVGTLTLDDPLPNDESIDSKALKEYLPKVKVWEEQLAGYLGGDSCATFTTFPRTNRQNKTTDHISFVVGSCRYPGLGWRTKNSDVIFKPILNHAVAETDKINFVLMVGDQIYADKASRFIPVGKADTNAEFQERYHNAFGSPNMRKLLRNVPHYMILDDHEIEDNWIQDRINKDKDKRELFQMAFFYYMVYQSMHAPKNFGDRPYYSFDCGGYPFFVLDTRTQRTMSVDADPWDDIPLLNRLIQDEGDASLATSLAAMIKERLSGEDDDNHMLGRPSPHHPTQLSRLLDWLEQQQKSLGNAPKFVVSSSVFAPNPISARVNCSRRAREASDSWPGFPKTKRAILNHIVTKKIQNVIFISGDIHCSNVAELTFSGTESAENLKAFSVTSSAFYWPFPFADGDPADYVHNSAEEDDTFIVNDKVSMDYTASHFTQQDNFCRVDVDKGTNRLVFTAYDKHGKTISEEVPHGGMQRIAARLQLAPW